LFSADADARDVVGRYRSRACWPQKANLWQHPTRPRLETSPTKAKSLRGRGCSSHQGSEYVGRIYKDLLRRVATSAHSLGKGFDSATFQISENGTVLEDKLFTDLASAQAFFSDNPIGITLLAGLNTIRLSFNETISGGDGFSFDYAAIAPVPLPPTLLLFAPGLGGLGLLGWRRKRRRYE
jgi:hypothetical protein